MVFFCPVSPSKILPTYLQASTQTFNNTKQQNHEKEIKNELGDLFFTLVSLARHLDVNPENALKGANRKFIDRFKIMEHLAKGRSRTLDEMTLEELESLWNQAKENI